MGEEAKAKAGERGNKMRQGQVSFSVFLSQIASTWELDRHAKGILGWKSDWQATAGCATGSCTTAWLHHQEFTLNKVWEVQSELPRVQYVLPWERSTNLSSSDNLKSTQASEVLPYFTGMKTTTFFPIGQDP